MTRIRAPELAPAVTWLNCVRPLSLSQLRGQVVVIDFWTHCCVNCIHTIPVLQALERRFAGEPIVFLGVHSAKFPGEARTERIEDAIARFSIDHPIVVDDAMQIWSQYAIASWPSLVLVRPDGTIASASPGEPNLEALSRELRGVLDAAYADGTLAAKPFDFHVPLKPDTGTLRFPGKAALSGDGRLAIADTGHHRVLVLAADGTIQACIGSGARGASDGAFDECCLNNPQGLAWDRDILWICDTGNHRVCQADLDSCELTTIAGTGALGHTPLRDEPVPALETALRSPWDVNVNVDHTRLYVTLAGSHQVAVIDLHPDGGITGPPVIVRLAGVGSEGLRDGPPNTAFFAQPSALVRDEFTLYVVDAESSAVREIDVTTGATTTLVGHGLFDFGDADGPLSAASMQHPMGMTRAEGALIIADAYNDSVRRLDLKRGVLTTIYRGEGEHGLRDPSDVVITPAGDYLVVDTGNHRLVRISADGQWKGEQPIEDAPTPATRPPEPKRPKPPPPVIDVLPLECEPLGPGRGELRLHAVAPEGWRFHPDSPLQLRCTVTRLPEKIEIAEQRSQAAEDSPELVIPMTLITWPPDSDAPADTQGELRIDVNTVLCTVENASARVPAHGRFRVAVSLTGTSPCDLDVRLPLRTGT